MGKRNSSLPRAREQALVSSPLLLQCPHQFPTFHFSPVTSSAHYCACPPTALTAEHLHCPSFKPSITHILCSRCCHWTEPLNDTEGFFSTFSRIFATWNHINVFLGMRPWSEKSSTKCLMTFYCTWQSKMKRLQQKGRFLHYKSVFLFLKKPSKTSSSGVISIFLTICNLGRLFQ